MRLKITNLDKLEAVLTKLDNQWPLAEESHRFFSHAIPAIRKKLQKGETIYLETFIDTEEFETRQYLEYWSDKDTPTDEDFLKHKK